MRKQDFTVLYFGDELPSTYAILKALRRRKDCGILVDPFLEDSCNVFREEIQNLPHPVRDRIPAFENVFDLVERLQRTQIHNHALESALCCVAQLAIFLDYFGELLEETFDPQTTYIIGHGLGTLPAAAIACCRTPTRLSSISLEIVRIVLRIGRLVRCVSQEIEYLDDVSGWSMTVFDATESAVKEEITEFNESQLIPGFGKIYVSGVGHGSVTISAPPSKLDRISRKSEYLNSKRCTRNQTGGLYNASHLYGLEDVQEILRPFISRNSFENERCMHILSCSSGSKLAAPNLSKLLEQVIFELLGRPFNRNAGLDAIVASIASSESQHCHVLTCGSTLISTEIPPLIRSGVSAKISSLDLVSYASSKAAADGTLRKGKLERIAIIGMAGRFPGANNCEELWNLLQKGVDMHRTIPSQRFSVETHVDPSGAKRNTSHTPYGCFIEEPGMFDARFFSMSPREAVQTDPMHRLAIVTAYEALEMSGFVPNRTPSTRLSRVGTFYGQTSDDWREINAAQRIETFFVPGGVRAFAPGRINYHFKFSGPSYSIDTACSSGLAAVQVACSSLINRECDMAVSGGLNILTNPDIFAGLSRGQFLSKTGSCKVFDAQADGYCRADAAGTVVLKRLDDAEDDNDNILGVILGCATNHSADAISITHPHAESQARLYQSVLNSAGVDPLDISYIEMHGTGTQAGDTNEMRSVTDVFAPSSRQRKMPLRVGAVKANVGHSEAAAGITGLLKLLLMLQKATIPRHIGIKTAINPRLPENLASRSVHIPLENTPWEPNSTRLSFLNNFSAAGGNTALLLEEGPPKKKIFGADPRSTHVVAVSAKSVTSLRRNVDRLVSYVEHCPRVSLPSLAYTTTARRLHHNYRLAVAVSRPEEIISQITSAAAEPLAPAPSSGPTVIFAFTGQGSFYRGLGKGLFETSSCFRDFLRKMNALTEKEFSVSFLPAVGVHVSHSDDLSESSVVNQLAQICVQMALVELWRSWNISPKIVIGHSLGEYAALYAAGVLSASDTIYLVIQRARLLEKHCEQGTHGMLAVKGETSSIQAVCHDLPYDISCINSETEVVLSGSMTSIERITQKLTLAGFKCFKLNTPYAFHSSQVDPILDTFKTVVRGIHFQEARIPVLSPLLKKIVTTQDVVDPVYLARHMREPVDFRSALQELGNGKLVDSNSIFVEIGPHPVCAGMIRAHFEAPKILYSFHKKEDVWSTLSKSLVSLHCAGSKVNWSEVHRDFQSGHQLLDLPSYAWDERNHWIDYVGDWCLTKGDSEKSSPPSSTKIPAVEVNLPLWQRRSNFRTSSLHYLLEEEIDKMKGRIIMQTDISEPLVRSAITGHMVNGNALCPSSLYAEMAMAAADYLYKRFKPSADHVGLDVCHMEVTKPLIAAQDSGASQILQVSAYATAHLDRAEIAFDSVDSNGKKTIEHAKCIVEYKDSQGWLDEWASLEFLVKERIDSLQRANAKGLLPSITKGLAYKLFGAMVQYDERYRGMQLVILDGPKFEATATVSFPTSEGNFFCSPFWIDSLCHISGFILNASDATDTSQFAFISHGWQYLRFAKRFSKDKEYRSYVRMVPAPGNVYKGDVYIFDDGAIVGVVGGLKFQQIRRALLNQMLPQVKPQSAPAIATAKRVQQTVRPPPNAQRAHNLASVIVPMTPNTKNLQIGPDENQTVKLLIAQVRDMICDVAEVELVELQNDCAFSDIGIDSLLSMTIEGRMREELNLEIPTSLFFDYPTVGELEGFLSRLDSGNDTSSESYAISLLASSSFQTSIFSSPLRKSDDSGGPQTPTEPDAVGLLNIVRAEIAKQMDVPREEVAGSTNLGELGMDSLMTLSVLGALREEAGMNFPADFFVRHPSIDNIDKFLRVGAKTPPLLPQKESQVGLKIEQLDRRTLPPAKSILLQGNRAIASKNLFLFPDGSGIAAAYAAIPNISPDLAVYGLNCPFMTTPEDFTIGIPGVATLYLAEVRRRQPAGPYLIGGWSAGGVVAYEVMQQLFASGERVERLILLDAPCPTDIVALPSRLHHFFNDIGLLGEPGNRSNFQTGSRRNKIPDWLLPHFESCIRNLVAYEPVPIIDAAKAPKICAVWARYGVCRYPDDPKPPFPIDDPPHLRWLLENRTDFGANGWETLVPEASMEWIEVLDGNHFSIMRDPIVNQIGVIIRKALQS